jgi:hypothetical protein
MSNSNKLPCGSQAGYCSIRFFWIVKPIQIYHKYVINNPNPNFKMDGQSNHNPTIIGKRYRAVNFLNGQIL